MGHVSGAVVRVLQVDDDPAMLDVSAEMLERENDQFSVETTTSPTAAVDRLEEPSPVDCVVSDYQMPKMNGLDLLEAVHDREPDLPFVLFTGKGSEEIASEAISAGVTDYIQKSPGSDQFTVLANRIENAVAQRRAQAAVRQTKQRYRTLISESSDVIAVVDPGGSVQYVSPAVERVLGYSEDELVGAHVFEHVHPDDGDAVETLLDGPLSDPSLEPTAEFRFQRGDGSWIRLEGESRNLLEDDVIEGVVLYARDVTERAEREADLERYEQIVEVAGDGAYFLDEMGNYEMVNGKTVERTGYSADELVGTHGSLVMDEDDVERAENALLRAFRNGDLDFAQFEATVHARDGTEYPVEIRTAPIVEDGRIDGAVGVSRDIADRKKRERELERYEKIVETAGDAAHVIDADGRFTLVNDALVERTGYTRDELVGSHVRTVVDDADYQRGTEAIQCVLDTEGKEFSELEITLETCDGERFPAAVRMAPIVEDGDVRGSVGIVREITDQKRRERELERQNERFRAFATAVAQDLRNPLNEALTRTELVRTEPAGDHLDAVEAALSRMDALVADLLTFAGDGRTIDDRDSLDVGSVSRDAWESIGTGGATLRVEDDVTVDGDRSSLRQAFETLFRSSLELCCTRPPSATAQEAGPEHLGQTTITVGSLPESGFYVEGDGPEIDVPDDVGVFDTGSWSKPPDLDVGLWIVRDVVRSHEWEIRLTEHNDSTRFEVRTDRNATQTDA